MEADKEGRPAPFEQYAQALAVVEGYRDRIRDGSAANRDRTPAREHLAASPFLTSAVFGSKV